MRYALAVLTAATAQVLVFLRVGDWLGVTAALALAYLMVAAAGAGFFAARRGPLAGALSVLFGALAYGVVSYVTRDELAVADLGSLLGWEARLVLSVVPYALGGAAAGWLGARLRAMVIR